MGGYIGEIGGCIGGGRWVCLSGWVGEFEGSMCGWDRCVGDVVGFSVQTFKSAIGLRMV